MLQSNQLLKGKIVIFVQNQNYKYRSCRFFHEHLNNHEKIQKSMKCGGTFNKVIILYVPLLHMWKYIYDFAYVLLSGACTEGKKIYKKILDFSHVNGRQLIRLFTTRRLCSCYTWNVFGKNKIKYFYTRNKVLRNHLQEIRLILLEMAGQSYFFRVFCLFVSPHNVFNWNQWTMIGIVTLSYNYVSLVITFLLCTLTRYIKTYRGSNRVRWSTTRIQTRV